MCEPIFDYKFRFILVGDSTVGKSSILRFFTDGKFEDDCHPTVGVDLYARLIEVKPGVRVKLQIWDTAGQERFRSITRSYYRNSVGVIMVYDISKGSTFDHLKQWYDEVQSQIEPYNAIFVILGNKADREDGRQVTTHEGKRFADMYGIHFFETSVVTGQNIEQCFTLITQDIYHRLQDGHIQLQDGWDGIKPGFTHVFESVHLSDRKSEERTGCC